MTFLNSHFSIMPLYLSYFTLVLSLSMMRRPPLNLCGATFFFHRPWVLFCIFSYRFFSVSKSRVTPVENHCSIYSKSVICYSTDSSVSRTPMMCLEAPLVPALQWKIFISYCKIWMWTDYELPSTGIWRKANRWETFVVFWKHFVF